MKLTTGGPQGGKVTAQKAAVAKARAEGLDVFELKPKSFFSVADAARILGVTRVTVWRLCRSGKIGRMVVGRYVIDRQDVESILKERSKA